MGLRFIVLYKKEPFKPHNCEFKVFSANSTQEAIQKASKELKIPLERIDRDEMKEGIYSCNCLNDYYGVD